MKSRTSRGQSACKTIRVSGISRPRPATSVVQRYAALAALKSAIAFKRADYEFLDVKEIIFTPAPNYVNAFAAKRACAHVEKNIIAFADGKLRMKLKSTSILSAA